MYPYLIRITFVVFFMIIISILMGVPTCLCVDHEDYVACGESFQCANIPNIGYPFWGEGRNQSCGYPGFELYNCQGDVPLINIQSLTYRLLGIDSSGRTLTVAREDLWNNTCPTYLHNTTLDFTRFTYVSSAQNVTLHYGCTEIPGQLLPLANQFPCTVNDSTNASSSYFVTGAVSSTVSLTLYMMCSNNVIVPVNQTSGEALTETSASIDDLRQGLAGGFGLQWEANNTNCSLCQLSDGRCGYNLTANSFACYCADQPYSVVCPQTGSTNSLHLGLRIAIGFSIIVAVIIILSTVVICCVRRQCLLHKAVVFWMKKEEMNDQNIEAFIRNHGSLAPKRYNYLQIKKMTNSFKEKIGKGGYGSVYKGKLSDGVLVAVKFLRETKGNGEEFINEVASISRTSHVNVVTLLGFCYERNKRALIYEFMPNGSLDKFIYNERSHLDWKTLYQIAVSAARGLEYLHRGCNTSIVHLDIKPQNILLDEDFCPKISDFGLAKLCKRKESVVSMMGARGTVGYIAPEVFSRNFGAVSHKSDVYSYGMMVLDIAGARKKTEEVGVARTTELYFPDWIYERIELHEDLRVLYGVTTEEEAAAARKMILVSLWCIQTNPTDRPSMRKVVEMLEGSLQSLQIPPKPFLFSPPRVANDSCPSLSLSSENVVELTTSINQ